MAVRPVLHGLSLCAGVGMLDEGIAAGFDSLGIDFRTVCFVERDSYAAAALVARMEGAALDRAPVWPDLTTFEARRWRGAVDCVSAGFPCQPWSVAGKREGTDDERWIWPEIVRIIRDVAPRWVVLENVRGLVSGGGLDAVLADLARLGFDAEWGVLSAAAVGASHRRERVFIVANAAGERCERLVADEPGGRFHDADAVWRGAAVADASSTRRQQVPRGAFGDEAPDERWAEKRNHEPASVHASMADASWIGCSEGRAESARFVGRSDVAECGCAVGDADRARPQRGGQRGDESRRQEQDGHARLAGRELFAPGPSDERWGAIIETVPWLAPAVEPGVRRVADGLAYRVHEHRADRLRCVGNGVVAAQAAAALVLLARRGGFVAMTASLALDAGKVAA